MDLRKDARTYTQDLTRISDQWSRWDEYTQWRRRVANHYEFRRSTPLCMLAGLGLAGLALDFLLMGVFVERGNWVAGLVSAAAACCLFPVGRGVVIDGMKQKVVRWWGWIPKPLFARSHDFSEIKNLRITLQLGIKSGPSQGRSGGGRTVRRPLYLVTSDGKRILLKPCRWVNGARALAKEIGSIMAVPVIQDYPDDDDGTY